MTPDQIARIPTELLHEDGTACLRDWLHDRGLSLTLAELDAERRRRTTAGGERPRRRMRRGNRRGARAGGAAHTG